MPFIILGQDVKRVKIAKEVEIIKEVEIEKGVMARDFSPVVMFCFVWEGRGQNWKAQAMIPSI